MPIGSLVRLELGARLPCIIMVDAASTIIFLPSAAVPFRSAAIAGSKGSPGLLPLTMIVVPGRVVIWADPLACTPAKMPTELLPCMVIVPLR